MISVWQLLKDTPRIMRDPLSYMLEAVREHGDVVPIDMRDRTVFLIADPDAAQHILQLNYRNYTKETIQFRTFSAVTGNGLLNSDGAFWLNQRRIAQPAFHRRSLEKMEKLIVDEAQRVSARWERLAAEGSLVDIEHEMLLLSMPVICRALFSLDIGAQADELVTAVSHALDYVMFRARTFVEFPSWFPLPVMRRYDTGMRELLRFVDRMIEQRLSETERPDDLLSMLLGITDADSGDSMPLDQVRDEVITAIVAGYETVATGMTWMWYLLDQYPQAAAALRAELASVTGGHTPSLSDLRHMDFLGRFTQESFRLYPPSWLISRLAMEDDNVAGTVIPARSTVIISPYVMHRNPRLWRDPERFDADRFLPERDEVRHRFAYIPFGGGPRLCIGNRFAEMESGLVMATLAARFAPRYASKQPPFPQALVTVRPKGGLPMHISHVPDAR